MKKINNNVYYLKNEFKTINTIKKTIILEKKSKYDSLDFSIILDTLTNQIKGYNKLEFKKIKALNYNLDFKATIKEIAGNILINLKIDFINLEYISNSQNILELVQNIFNGLYISKEDLDLTINDYNNLYNQIKDMNDQYTMHLLKDLVYKDEQSISSFEENQEYLKDVKTEKIKEKIKLLKNENFYYILEGAESTLIKFTNFFESENKALKKYTNLKNKLSNEFEELKLLKNEEQVSIAMSYQGDINRVEDEYTLKLLNNIIGHSAFSLLFKNVREKESLCYSIYSQEDLNYGINIFTGVEYKNIQKAKEKINEQFNIILEGKFEEEFIKVKQKYIADLLQESKKLVLQETLLQKNIIYNTQEYELNKIIDRIENITMEDIQMVCKKLRLTKIVLKN